MVFSPFLLSMIDQQEGDARMKDSIVEKIGVADGVLVINRHYMALQTPDGVLHPADLDQYGQYQPIQELIRLISRDAEFAEAITDDTKTVLRQALLGEHSLLSYPLIGAQRKKEDMLRILEVMNPQTQDDFIRTLCLIRSEGLYAVASESYPFVCREELRDYLRQYINEEYVFGFSEAVRKGLLFCPPEGHRHIWDYYREELMLLPGDTVELFSRIKYLPRKFVAGYIIRYAVIAANSLIRNNNFVIH